MADIDPVIRRLGRHVAEYRTRLGVQQNQMADLASGTTRTEIAHLEEGRSLPSAERLEVICTALKMPRHLWYPATHDRYLEAMNFEAGLSELVGKPVSLDQLDDMSRFLCVDAIAQMFVHRMSPEQGHAHFNSILTFYGERSVTRQFFDRFLGTSAFSSIDAFRAKVEEFLKVAIRVYGSFRQAFQTLRSCHDIEHELRVLAPIDESLFTQRRAFDVIRPVPTDRLDDLGYISAERVRRESRERTELSTKLMELARATRERRALDAKRMHRIQTLLRKFGSRLDIENTLFTALDPEELEREGKRLAPEDVELVRIEETQDAGRKNLSAYLTEPYMDVYVATSMRERADFVSVNSFVEALFRHPEIAHLHLRYFNPTQSWIDDRVAKGLVEALMLRRSRMTVYMAQKSDTFGKDSEASVALGQGKPVIVYVPKLHDDTARINSEELMMLDVPQLEATAREMALDPEEGVDKQALTASVLHAQLMRLGAADIDRITLAHWADFDLYGELANLEASVREGLRSYLDALLASNNPLPREGFTAARQAVVERLVGVALRFEARAKTFREIHPLALQVILSSGVLNGILVVRSVPECARIMYQLLTNQIETELIVDEQNYKLVERQTRSTLRVISKNKILTNAFWTQYFPEVR